MIQILNIVYLKKGKRVYTKYMSESAYEIKDTSANPAPLGLLGFGMTTVLLNIHNAGFFPLSAMLVGMGMFFGGIGQVLAGLMEWKKGNTFGTTAFTSYGLFWLSLVTIWILPKLELAGAPDPVSMGVYLGIWGLLTFFLFLSTLRLNHALQVVFASLTLLFLLLSYGNLTANADILKVAGFVGIFCGFSAIYAAVAQVTNEVHGFVVLPLGVVKKK